MFSLPLSSSQRGDNWQLHTRLCEEDELAPIVAIVAIVAFRSAKVRTGNALSRSERRQSLVCKILHHLRQNMGPRHFDKFVLIGISPIDCEHEWDVGSSNSSDLKPP